jgi:hypothetical protein
MRIGFTMVISPSFAPSNLNTVSLVLFKIFVCFFCPNGSSSHAFISIKVDVELPFFNRIFS